MPKLINIPYSRQQSDGYCLPACAQMALAYLGISRSQQELGRIMGMIAGLGVPASHILRLRSSQIQVEYHTEGQLEHLRAWLMRQIPVIACVQTSELTYWRGHIAQHVILLVGTDEHNVYLLDPAQNPTVISVSIDEFLLAWDEMEFAYIVIAKS
jgi:ABC-type bacteriocin/lantibiotic exporter with double-glycine peptidase domain